MCERLNQQEAERAGQITAVGTLHWYGCHVLCGTDRFAAGKQGMQSALDSQQDHLSPLSAGLQAKVSMQGSVSKEGIAL